VLVFAKVGMGQVTITTNYSPTYNGAPKSPPYSITGCCNEIKLYTDNSNGNSIGSNAPVNAGSYKLRVTFTSGDDVGFFDEQNFVINKATPTLSVKNSPLTYTASTQSATLSSSVAGLTSNIKYSGSTIVPTNAGTYTITADFAPNEVLNYNSLTGATAGNFVINKAPVTISNIVLTKVYDGTPNISVIDKEEVGIISGDNVVITGNPTSFSNKIVANNYSSTVTFSLTTIPNTGKENNYYISGINPILITNGSITKLPITLTANTNTKVYDGTVSATATPTITTGALVSGDIGTFIETYDTKTQGTNKVLTPAVVSILDATNTSMAGNYSITYQTNTSGVITKLPITLTASTNTKVYDGTISSTATPTLTGTLASGDIGVYSQTYDTKSQGTSKVLKPTATILDATNESMIGNYSITYTSVNTGVIEKRPITLTANTNTKVYDGTLSSTATPTLTGALASGDIGVYSQTYDTKSQGTSKVLKPTATILDATNESMIGNYSITYTSVNTGVITAKQLMIADPTITKSKEYDKKVTVNTTAGTLSGVVTVGSSTDAVTVSSVGTYSTSTVGTGKTITVVYTLTGADKDNYIKPVDKVYTDGVITVRSITISAIASDKVYDGNATATATLTDNKISGDDLTVNKTGATFNNKNIGTGKAVTVSGITLTGTDAGNYTLTSATATGTASITVRSLTVSATASDKVYDGNTNATINLTDNKISGDDLTVNKTGATFNDKNVGTGKTINISGINLTGTDAGNYSLINTTATGTASITVRNLIITAIAKNKPYDGNRTAEVTLTSNKINSDNINYPYTLAEFDTKEIGDNKTVTITGISILGLDALNYMLTNTTATAIANITGNPEAILILPNAFTPNGDGNNDIFKIASSNILGKASFRYFEIYNRNGKLMHSEYNISEGWDGRFGGIIQDMGVYFVKLVKVNKDGQQVIETTPFYLLK
jgi:gliding motility-associated-like protein